MKFKFLNNAHIGVIFFIFEWMKFLKIILILTSSIFSAQKILPFDSLKLHEAKDFLVDDYGSIYLYNNRDLSFTKYDLHGSQVGKMMLAVPFFVQNVQNPLCIPLFSENAQELKLVDQNLNEIQKIDFRDKFGSVKAVYTEDLQQIWLLEESMKRLVQYNFREDKIINSYLLDIEFDEVKDILVHDGHIYILSNQYFTVYDFKSQKIFCQKLLNGKRLRRENEAVYIISENSIYNFMFPNGFQTVFNPINSRIVDKNSSAYFDIKGNNLYLYPVEKK